MMEEDKEKEDRWYFQRDVLANSSPSRRHGYDSDRELSCRQQAANLIQDMGQKLQVSQLCINTAIVYMHRFYVFHSLHAFPRNNIAAAALFLAAKVEEQPRKVEHVLKVAHLCLHRDNPSGLDIKSEAYQEQANELTLNESIILQTLGFEVAIDHPHTHVVRCCQLVKASKDLAQTSYFMASNSLHLTTMCLQYKPTVVACFCIHLACKWSNWEIPRSSEGRDWFWYVNQSVTLDLLEQMTSEFLSIFDKCPTKLKRKMMSMNQNNVVNFGAPAAMPESYHFDEPRKLTGAEANRPPEGFVAQLSRPSHSSSQQHQAAPPAPAQQPAQSSSAPHPVAPRHMDYKEYKEKKERAERERLAYQNQHGGGLGHPSQKVPEKPKIVPPSGQQMSSAPQQRPPSSSSSSAHKNYQQQRPHMTQPAKELSHPSRPTVKDSLKRKFEETDAGETVSDAKSSEFRHKPPVNYPGYHDPHASKDIRDIIQFPHKPRLEEKHPHMQRPTDKYQNRPQMVALKPDGKPDEIMGESKPGQTDRYGKPLPLIPPGQSKPRDIKYKHHPVKDASAKPPSNAVVPPPNTGLPMKKPEKLGEKRRYHDGLEKMASAEELRQKTAEQKKSYAADVLKREKEKANAKLVTKPKPLLGLHFEKPPTHGLPSLFDLPGEIDSPMELPSLLDPIERPSKIPRVEEKKILDDRRKADPFGHHDRRDDKRKIDANRFEERKKKEAAEERKRELFGLSEPPKVEPKPKVFSIFSPDSKDIQGIKKEPKEIYGGYQKKALPSLFSPPSTPILPHKNEPMIPVSVPTASKPEKRPDDHSFFDFYDKAPKTTKPVPKTEPPAYPKVENLVRPLMGAVMQPSEFPVTIVAPPIPKPIHTMAPNPISTILLPPEKQNRPEQDPPIEPAAPASTVNLMNMVDMLDTRTSMAAVIKPPVKIEAPPVKPRESIKPPEEKRHSSETEHRHKSESKKSKDKDKDRHREKKDAKKEKKKHKDKDKERDKKKDSHRDREKEGDRSKEKVVPVKDNSLKITIPKDKISEATGLKLKISKDRPSSPVKATNEGGSLKITIKKEAIANYKDEWKQSAKKRSKEKGESSSSHHKSSKSSKSDPNRHKSSKPTSSSIHHHSSAPK